MTFIASLDSTYVPKYLSKARHSCWANLEEEMMVSDNNGTYDLVYLPIGKQAIDRKCALCCYT